MRGVVIHGAGDVRLEERDPDHRRDYGRDHLPVAHVRLRSDLWS